MSTVILTKICLLFFLIICSGVFSGSETSIFSLGRIERFRIREEEDTQIPRALHYLLQRPQRLIITLLIGNNLINICVSALVASFAGDMFTATGWLQGPAWVLLKALATTLICLPLLLIFAEIIPKTAAMLNPLGFARFVAVPIKFFYHIVTPVRWFLAGLAKSIARIVLGELTQSEEVITEHEFRSLVDLSKKGGVLWESEHEFIHNIFDFGETRVSEVMTPRTDMFVIHITQPLSEILKAIEEHHFSRMPVYDKDKDDIVGILYSKDLLQLDLARQNEWNIEAILRVPYYIPQTKMASDLFREFRSNRIHQAIVVDEYGGVAGLVTMEDLLEELFGEILDEYDPEEPEMRQVDKNTIIIPAKMSIEEFNKRLDVSLPEEEYDTMGGLVFDLFGKLPSPGAKISFMHYTFTVNKMLGTRILELQVQQKVKETDILENLPGEIPSHTDRKIDN